VVEKKPKIRCPHGFEEFSDDPELEWECSGEDLCFFADADVPRLIVEEIRANDIPVHYAQEDGAAAWPDEQIRARAHELGCVVLTFNRHFWQDGRHPLDDSAGIVFVSIPNDRPITAVEALGSFYGAFAHCWPAEFWERQKARVYPGGFMLRFIDQEGKLCESDVRFVGDGMCTQTICKETEEAPQA
jgi:hypothetical protein